MKAKYKPTSRIEYERGVTDGGRAYRDGKPTVTKGSRSYVAGFDRGVEIEIEKDAKADRIAVLNAEGRE